MKLLMWCAVFAGGVVSLLAMPALAAQVVDLSLSAPGADGEVYVSGTFDWPPEGRRATAKLTFSGFDVIDAVFSGYVEERKTWWDDDVGGIWGNEYLMAYDCDLSSGCVTSAGGDLMSAVLSTPRGFDRPCGPTTSGDCSSHYFPQWGSFDGTFRVKNFDGPYSVTLTIGDFSAVPEAATWVSMIIGFGLIGGAVRQTRRSRQSANAPHLA
ncbi:PEPxxWA-CTERM sorting domain-containing protein [Phenylobacterium sp.]|jgi:hypothetical protein|uniref:PEPxxWA-CTERM sorting domain-containing protein n=1 Tax=Phenylobacterium sp. TaxID=1871053 RepID=UPI0035AF1935